MSSARGEGTSRTPSLRRLLAILLAVLGLLVVGLLGVASLQTRGADQQTRAENRRTTSFLLADGLRQSSNDLTNMVRLYVATGQRRYRDYYDEILAIRAGSAPRPRNYDSSFWDRVLAEGKGFVRYGPPQSLTARMRAAQFTGAEFRALQDALRTSNGLAAIERAVIANVDRRIRRGIDARYGADVQPLYRRLVSDAYIAEKGAIMRAIGRFTALVEARTLRAVQAARAHNRDLTSVLLAIVAAIALVGLGAMVVLSRLALRPLTALIATTRRIAGGDYEQRVSLRAVRELERVAASFNEMAGAVQADVEARERAERDAVAAERDAVAARQVAEHASRSKSTFLAAMSHEIRTPMIGVTGMLEVLARTDMTVQQQQMVATAESSAASLLQIIGDILDFSKIEADRLELAPTTFDLRAVVRAAVETFVHTASAKGLLLTWSAPDELAPAHVGDPLRLRQIIANLLSNAVKFTAVGGIEVAVAVIDATDAAQTIEVAVSDTGIGVAPEQQEQLFAEFSQADASTTRRYGGTGLGLVICRRLALLMGGDIAMHSQAGRGTTMRLTVPLALGDPAQLAADAAGSARAAQASRPRPTREQAEREGSLLLLAEDHPVNRTVLGHQLDLIGFHVDVAEDGQAAYETWLSGRYALVLSDLNMPRMDGYELARKIRAHELATGAPRTPIIALSANVMSGEPDKCRAAGMDDFAAKPTTIPFLGGRLQHWLPHLAWSEEVIAAPMAAPAATGTGAGDGVLDPATLDHLTGGDAELAAELVGDFLETTGGDLDALDAAIVARDSAGAARQAHRIKGAARLVGAHTMIAAAQQIETRGEQGIEDWEEIAALAARLAGALQRAGAPG